MSESSPGKGVEVLLPCPFCGGVTPMVLGRTCDKHTPYNPADRAFPVVRCGCGAAMDGENWGGKDTAVAAWNRRASPVNPAVPPSSKEPDSSALVDARRYRALRKRLVRGELPGNSCIYEADFDAVIDAEIKKEGTES